MGARSPGNFSHGRRVLIRRGCYEGLFHKPANKDLADVGGACGRACLSGMPNRSAGGGSRGCAGSRANGVEHDLSEGDLSSVDGCAELSALTTVHFPSALLP